jgi:endonuclease/exonuclease/phosphatase family metal-dependent hydrolase
MAEPRYRRFTPVRVALFLVLVGAVVVWEGSNKIATLPGEGVGLNGTLAPTDSAGETLRVAAYNIDGGVGKTDGRLDLDRTAAALRGYDLVALEEIHGDGILGGADQAQILGEKLKMPWLFAPVERQWWHDSFGDGLVTSLPCRFWQRWPLATGVANSNRGVLLAELDFHGRKLHVLITHLERHDDRAGELRTVIALFQSLEQPAILMGDLNTDKDDPQIQALRAEPGICDPIGQALDGSHPNSIDWIFARGMTAVAGGFKDNGASDHPLVWAELK